MPGIVGDGALSLETTTKFIIQPFHPDRGKFVAGTRDEAKRLFKERNWTLAAYRQVLAVIKRHIADIGEGKEGFAPI